MMTIARAQDLIAAMRAEAERRVVPSAYAVVDGGGHLVAFEVDDGVILASRDLAINKAWTALTLQQDTASLAAEVQPGADFFGLAVSSRERSLIPFAGGVPIGDPVFGACGVSGGDIHDDLAIVAAATATVE